MVAHAVPQHVIMNIVSEGIPRWNSGGIVYRLAFICCVALMYPFTAAVRICAPDSYIGRMAAKPLIKFINSVASFVTLLGMYSRTSWSFQIKRNVFCSSYIWKKWKSFGNNPVSTRRCFSVVATLLTFKQRYINVKTTLCAYREVEGNLESYIETP